MSVPKYGPHDCKLSSTVKNCHSFYEKIKHFLGLNSLKNTSHGGLYKGVDFMMKWTKFCFDSQSSDFFFFTCLFLAVLAKIEDVSGSCYLMDIKKLGM